MLKGLEHLQDRTVRICKGGIHPKDVLQLLPSFTDELRPEHYNSVRSVTVVVGTNALNIKPHAKGIPLLDIIFDCEKLIYDLTKLFPNARIGFYNVIPRAYSTIETRHRIDMFNEMFSSHVVKHFPNVFWIRQYSDYVDNFGYLRGDLYGRDGVHLNRKGKKMMAQAIRNFQDAYY